MRKHILILIALTLGAGLYAAGVPTPVETALALRVSREVLAKLPNKTAADRAAIVAAREVWDTDNAAAVETLLPQIDAILAEDAASGGFLIRYTLNARNTGPDGKIVRPFKRDAADLTLAAKLEDVTAGGSNAYYIRYYATPEEIAALPGSRSAVFADAVYVRSTDLATPALAADYYTRCLGLGLYWTRYNIWFDNKVTSLMNAGKDAEASRLSKVEAFALNQHGNTANESVKQRLVKLRGGKQLAE
jgi:hypothetical protein